MKFLKELNIAQKFVIILFIITTVIAIFLIAPISIMDSFLFIMFQAVGWALIYTNLC